MIPDVSAFGINVADTLQASAGIEVSVWTHIAKLSTNVTSTPDDTNCKLRVEESYELVVGAAAGATVAVASQVWGPTPNTTIPIWYTTVTQCAIAASVTTAIVSTPATTPATVTSSAVTPKYTSTVLKRQLGGAESLLQTISTAVAYRGVQCMSLGLINCPVSLQQSTKAVRTITLVTSVPSGVVPTFPATIQTTISQVIPFGTAANKLFATKGAPTAYSASSTQTSTGFLDGEIGGIDKRIIFGVAVGGGALILLTIIGCCCFFCRRKKYVRVVEERPFIFQTESYHSGYYDPTGKKLITSTEREIHR
ncbi:hypothetical protein ABW20_dc0101213 [Dactylellina cionopaga]|nr:hypothetical protein ABW20_dc0101213 [Dactylellina cionopaga]